MGGTPMKMRSLHLALLGLLTVPVVAFSRGGWAVTTLDDLPDYVTAGEPVKLSYTVRQHGMTLLDGLYGNVTATAGRGTPEVKVPSTGDAKGHYSATVVLPAAGEWTITVNSGFGMSTAKLYPIRAIARGATPPAITPADRGRRLFAAKGCMECHVHREVAGSGVVNVGPELTTLRFEPEYLARYLVNPAIKPPTRDAKMPALNLKPAEITALTAFINAEGRVADRR
jgi:mono/diheme cytochrome c family protein